MCWVDCTGIPATGQFAFAFNEYGGRGRVWAVNNIYFAVEINGSEGTLPNGAWPIGDGVIGMALCFSGTTCNVYLWHFGDVPALHSVITYSGAVPTVLVINGYAGEAGWGSWMQELYIDDAQWTLEQVQAQALHRTAQLGVVGHWHLNGGDNGAATVGDALTRVGTFSTASTGVSLAD
jgi:hypothetical protein